MGASEQIVDADGDCFSWLTWILPNLEETSLCHVWNRNKQNKAHRLMHQFLPLWLNLTLGTVCLIPAPKGKVTRNISPTNGTPGWDRTQFLVPLMLHFLPDKKNWSPAFGLCLLSVFMVCVRSPSLLSILCTNLRKDQHEESRQGGAVTSEHAWGCVCVHSHLASQGKCIHAYVVAIQLFHHGTLQACPLSFAHPTSAVACHWAFLLYCG